MSRLLLKGEEEALGTNTAGANGFSCRCTSSEGVGGSDYGS